VATAGAEEVTDGDLEGVAVLETVELRFKLPGPVNGFVAFETTMGLKGTVAFASAEILLLELIVLPGTHVPLPQAV
jgi:hypothetical protein